VKEITSKNIRKLDDLFRIYTVIALFGGFVFLSCAAAKSWIFTGISLAIVIFAAYAGWRIELEIADQKVITQALSDARDVKVAALYGKETPDEEEHSNL